MLGTNKVEMVSKVFKILSVTLATTFINKNIASKVSRRFGGRKENISCHYSGKGSETVKEADIPKDKNIIFLETSCVTKNTFFSLSSRQACAVESAARHNPEYTTHVLFVGPRNDSNDNLHEILKKDYKVKFHKIDLMTYVKDTPVMDLVMNKLLESKHAMTHLSDVLRLLTLWKYGGVYLDLDVVVVKSLRDLPPCFVGAENQHLLGNAVVALDRSEVGRRFADLFIRELVRGYDGSLWMQNGPKVITNIIKNLCPNNNSWPSMCDGMRVLEPVYLYPIHWTNWSWYTERQSLLHFDKDFEDKLYSQTVVHHFWNSLSQGAHVRSYSLYASLATANCPRIYDLTFKNF